MSSLRRANAARSPCRRRRKGGFNAGGATTVPELDGSSVARDCLAPPDMVCTTHSVIKRVSFAGHAAQLEQENLIPPRMHARPGRKLNKTYQSSQSMPRMCSTCGMSNHFMADCLNPSIIELAEAKQQKTIKAANALVIDLRIDMTSEREYFPPLIKETSEENARNEKRNISKFRRALGYWRYLCGKSNFLFLGNMNRMYPNLRGSICKQDSCQ